MQEDRGGVDRKNPSGSLSRQTFTKRGLAMDKSKKPSAGAKNARGRKTNYKELLFGFVPLYTTRLVREGEVPYAERTKFSSPEDTAKVVMDYFLDKDREEFIVLLVGTVMWS
jgi:hypothetical protein